MRHKEKVIIVIWLSCKIFGRLCARQNNGTNASLINFTLLHIGMLLKCRILRKFNSNASSRWLLSLMNTVDMCRWYAMTLENRYCFMWLTFGEKECLVWSGEMRWGLNINFRNETMSIIKFSVRTDTIARYFRSSHDFMISKFVEGYFCDLFLNVSSDAFALNNANVHRLTHDGLVKMFGI